MAYLSQFTNCYGEDHFKALLRILEYLYHTRSRELIFIKTRTPQHVISAYSDSDWAYDIVDRKSYTGTVVFFNNALVSWSAKKQSIVALSSCEAEYIAAAETVKDMAHIKGLLDEITHVRSPMDLYIDNTGAAHLAEKDINNQRSKHIDTRFHFIRDWVQSKHIKIIKVHTTLNVADLFTKALPKATLLKHTSLGVPNRADLRRCDGLLLAQSGSNSAQFCCYIAVIRS